MTNNNPTNMRVEPCPIGGDGCWAVREGDEVDWEEGWGDLTDYGYLAGGFPNKAEAEAWLEDELLERQCQEWDRHIRQDEDDEPMPF